jgi:hypothetical protein
LSNKGKNPKSLNSVERKVNIATEHFRLEVSVKPCACDLSHLDAILEKINKLEVFFKPGAAMDKPVHEVRLSNWIKIFGACQSRPEGVTQKQWISENGMTVPSRARAQELRLYTWKGTGAPD